MTDRMKKIRFINECGPFALLRAVEAAFHRNGPDWLTDEQLDEIVSEQVRGLRERQARNCRNREIARERQHA